MLPRERQEAGAPGQLCHRSRLNPQALGLSCPMYQLGRKAQAASWGVVKRSQGSLGGTRVIPRGYGPRGSRHSSLSCPKRVCWHHTGFTLCVAQIVPGWVLILPGGGGRGRPGAACGEQSTQEGCVCLAGKSPHSLLSPGKSPWGPNPSFPPLNAPTCSNQLPEHMNEHSRRTGAATGWAPRTLSPQPPEWPLTSSWSHVAFQASTLLGTFCTPTQPTLDVRVTCHTCRWASQHPVTLPSTAPV